MNARTAFFRLHACTWPAFALIKVMRGESDLMLAVACALGIWFLIAALKD